MALKVADAASAAKKYVQRAQAAGPDYKKGVEQAGADWQQATSSAGDTYAQGVQDAIARNAFTKGVQKAGAQRYQERAAGVGAQRYPQGVAGAEGDWAQGTQPFLSTIAALTLPARRPKGDPANFERSRAVGMALRARKLGQS